MKVILFCLVIFLSLQGCKTNRESLSLTTEEQDKILQFAVKVEKDSSWAMITRAKHGFYYMVDYQFQDSIYLDSSAIHLIDKNINVQEIKNQYKKAIKENNKLISDSFYILHSIDFSNRYFEFLSFSKPIRYSKYYFINVSYNSWASGYSTFLILEKKDENSFNILYRQVYRVV